MSATANNDVEQPRPRGTLNQRFLAYLEHALPLAACRRQERLSHLWLGLAVLLTAGGAMTGVHFTAAWLLIPAGLALCAYGIRTLERARLLRLRCERQCDVVRHGEPVTAYIVRANRQLLQPGAEPLPATVLFTFQPEVATEPAYLRHLARRVAALHGTTPLNDDGRYIAGLTGDDKPTEYRRRPLPLSFTDGSTIYCADLWVKRSYLAAGFLAADTVPCLAERGEAGGIELVPTWLSEDTPTTISSSPSAAAGPAVE